MKSKALKKYVAIPRQFKTLPKREVVGLLKAMGFEGSLPSAPHYREVKVIETPNVEVTLRRNVKIKDDKVTWARGYHFRERLI